MYTTQFDLSIGVLPAQTLSKLRQHEILILDTICGLWNLDRLRNPSAKAKCWPSLKYLAKKSGVTLWTVSRSLNRLTKLGILNRWQRRKKNGIWRSNIFYLGRQMVSAVKVRIGRALEYVAHRLRVGATNKNQYIKRIKKDAPVDNFRGRKTTISDL